MERMLRCNNMDCRTELNDHAVVTACSHVFCLDCANRLQLSHPPGGQRPVCPACNMHLNNPDDAIVTNLNPTEDYKTTVLSGLSPDVIMECSGRALSFWAYQRTQEVVYQELVTRSLIEKYNILGSQYDNIVGQANAQITDLRDKIQDILADQDNLRRKNEELAKAFREKSHKCSQTQELYDKLKRRVMLVKVKNAAVDPADHTIQASAVSNRFLDPPDNFDPGPRHQTLHSEPRGIELQKSSFNNLDGHTPSMLPPVARGSSNQGWTRVGSHGRYLPQTPSSHRQRLADEEALATGFFKLPIGRTASAPLAQRQGTPGRQSLNTLSPSGLNGYAFAGYGMSAGVKLSHPLDIAQSNVAGGRSALRSRVAQRPDSSALSGRRGPSFTAALNGNGFGDGNGYL